MRLPFVIKLQKLSMYYIDCILVYIFFALTLYIFLFDYDSFFFNVRYAFLALAAVRGYYISAKKNFWVPWFLAIFFSINYFLCYFFQLSLNQSITNFTYTLFYIGLAVLLLEESYEIIGTGLLLAVCTGVIVVRYIQGVNPNTLLTYTSRNFISVLMLFVLLLFYLALYKRGNNGYFTVLVPAFIFFIVSVVAYGRGGILSSAFLFGVLGIYKTFESQQSWRRRAVQVITISVMILVVAYLTFSDQISIFLGKFAESATDEARMSYWTTFIKNNFSSWKDFLFGSNTMLIRTDGNLHNSFLQCYAGYGIVPFIALIVMCIRSTFQGIGSKDYLLVILMITLFIRAFTDRVFFQGYCEVFLFYFLMYRQYKNKYVINVQS